MKSFLEYCETSWKLCFSNQTIAAYMKVFFLHSNKTGMVQRLHSFAFIGWISSCGLGHSGISKFHLFFSALSSKLLSFHLFTTVESVNLTHDVQNIQLLVEKTTTLFCVTNNWGYQKHSASSVIFLPLSCLVSNFVFSGFKKGNFLLVESTVYQNAARVSCSAPFTMCFFLLHHSKTTAIFNIKVFIICLPQLLQSLFWMPISEQFLMSASISHQNTTKVFWNKCLAQGLQKLFL